MEKLRYKGKESRTTGHCCEGSPDESLAAVVYEAAQRS